MTDEEKAAAEKAAADKKAADEKKAAEGGGGEPTMQQVVAALQHLHATNKGLQGEITNLKKELAEKPAPRKEGGGDVEVKNLETMTRKEFMDTIIKEAGKHLVEPVKKEREEELIQRRRAEAKQQVDNAAKEHEDFWEYREEMKVIIDELPDIDIEEAYVLAKNRNKDKASLIDARIAKEKAKEREREKEKEEPKYGGLLPTSTTTKRSETMSPKDAAEAAWSETGAGEHLRFITN